MTRALWLRTAVVAASALAALAVGPLAPAYADPLTPDTDPAVLAASVVWVESQTSTSATVCARGWVDDGTPLLGEWVFRVVGPTALWTDPRPGPTYAKTCYTIVATGATAGVTDTSLAYVGVVGDVVAECTGTLAWAPGFPIRWLVGACTGVPSPSPAP